MMIHYIANIAHQGVLKVFGGCSGDVLGMFWVGLGGVWKVSGRCLGCSGGVWEVFRCVRVLFGVCFGSFWFV